MEFITVEQFQEQPVEAQKVFLDWWKPNIGDLATGRYEKIVAISSQRDIDAVRKYKGERYAMPLFTEGQLREFIEDKTLGIDVIQFKGNKITISIYDNSKPLCFREYKNLSDNLLQAYWKVACEIAKEG